MFILYYASTHICIGYFHVFDMICIVMLWRYSNQIIKEKDNCESEVKFLQRIWKWSQVHEHVF